MSRGRKAGNRNQGSNWCRRAKRLRIYERDGWTCIWCGRGVWSPHGHDPNLRATVDHVIPRAAGGTNDPQNLVTSCMQCNRARGARPALDFAGSFGYAGYITTLRALVRAMTTPL